RPPVFQPPGGVCWCVGGPKGAEPMHEPTRMQFKIRGMDCAEEVAVLKREVGPLVGGEDRLAFDILKARMSVAVAAEGAGGPAVSKREIVQAVGRTGMQAQAWREGSEAAEPEGV